jgi:hypothetical protein
VSRDYRQRGLPRLGRAPGTVAHVGQCPARTAPGPAARKSRVPDSDCERAYREDKPGQRSQAARLPSLSASVPNLGPARADLKVDRTTLRLLNQFGLLGCPDARSLMCAAHCAREQHVRRTGTFVRTNVPLARPASRKPRPTTPPTPRAPSESRTKAERAQRIQQPQLPSRFPRSL